MELYQSVIAKRCALLFPLSCRVNLPWRTSLLHASLHYFHIISHPRKPRREFRFRRGRAAQGEPYGRTPSSAGERERDTRGGQWDGCYFHATFDFPLRVTGISLFIFRLLNYIPINKLPAHRLPYLPFHRLRGKDNPFPPRREIVYLEKERRKLNFFFSSLLKGLVGI